MRVFVTGGAGFVGSHGVEHSLEAGFAVAVLGDGSRGPVRAGNIQRSLRDVSRFHKPLGAPRRRTQAIAETAPWYRER